VCPSVYVVVSSTFRTSDGGKVLKADIGVECFKELLFWSWK